MHQPSTATEENDEQSAAETSKGKNIVEIKSPIVGTFYRASGPDKPVFTKVGDQVKQGDVVCIIEAMKLFNEIESDATVQ
jgi:acetyl-CoA carboxylase biotin carboxyl carrier protein